MKHLFSFHFIVVLVLWTLMPGLVSAQQERPLNVLFIAVDDMNNDLGLYGKELIKSPNLDKLARQGVAFSKAYCQYPQCSPSRSSILTGLRPDSTRVLDLKYHFRQGLPDVVTLPQMFMNNGYFVARVGKIYHYGVPGEIGTNGLDDRLSWMERYNPAGLDKTALEEDIINFTPDMGLGHSLSWYDDKENSDSQHTDGKVASQTIELLKKHKDEPFFIAAGFYRPHCPYVATDRFFRNYGLKEISLPKYSEETEKQYPEAALLSTQPRPVYGLPEDKVRQAILAYYASISFVDAQIGKVLNALDSLGLRDNTIIVFWSDHGYHLGEHGLWFKKSLFEESAKTPLIISYPGMETAGESCDRLVEMVDIYPTLAELAGLTPPADLQGYSLVPLLEDAETHWEHPAFMQVWRKQDGGYMGYSIRTERWRYTEWDGGKRGKELYDEIKDPKELRNLAGEMRYKDVEQRLKEMLHKQHPRKVTSGKALPDTYELFVE